MPSLLLLLTACAPRTPTVPAPAQPTEAAEPAPPALPVMRACDQVVTDASSAVDLADAPATSHRARRIGPVAKHYGFVGEEVVTLDDKGALRVVGLDGKGDRTLVADGVTYWYADGDDLVYARGPYGSASHHAVPIAGGEVRDLPVDPQQARLEADRALMRELGRPGADFVRVSDTLGAIQLEQVVTVVDLEGRELGPVLPVKAYWPPVALSDERSIAVVSGVGYELWIADLVAGEARCAGVSRSGPIPPFVLVFDSMVAWTAARGNGAERKWEVHVSDLATGTDRLLATAADADMVLLQQVPGESRLIATVRWSSRDAMAFYDVPLDGAVRRLGPELPGGGGSDVGPDGGIVFVIGPPQPVSAPPPPPPRDDDRFEDGPACDPIGCPAGACGDMPDHCGGRIDCGPCPESRTVGPTSRGGYALGLYTIAP